MTPNEIIEGNKMISEFMGYFNWEDKTYGQYHTSWEWLMPVVEKISNYQYKDDDIELPVQLDYAYPRTFGMKADNGAFMVRFNRQSLFMNDNLLACTYDAVIEFLHWHNSVKK